LGFLGEQAQGLSPEEVRELLDPLQITLDELTEKERKRLRRQLVQEALSRTRGHATTDKQRELYNKLLGRFLEDRRERQHDDT